MGALKTDWKKGDAIPADWANRVGSQLNAWNAAFISPQGFGTVTIADANVCLDFTSGAAGDDDSFVAVGLVNGVPTYLNIDGTIGAAV